MRLPPSKLPNVGTTIFTVMSALANKHGAINLSQGFPNFDCDPKLVDRVYYYMQKGYNQYPPMMGVGVLRERLAEKVEKTYGAKVDPVTEITVVAGATQGLFTAIAAFIRPGDEVVLIEPAYDSYRPSVEVMGGVAVPYELSAPNYKIDWRALAAKVTSRTRMIIINSPHNPTGTCLEAEDLAQLEQLISGTNILILSDEVYEHLIYDGRRHDSVLRYPALYERSLAVYSFGKTFHNTGWKIGYCVAPPALTAEFRKVHQFNVFTVNTPIQYALADYMADEQTYLSLPEFYQQKRDFFLEQTAGTSLKPLSNAGTYFQLFDYSAISKENDAVFARRMTTEFGVAAIPVSVFYSNGRNEGVIRLCFAKTEETLAQAAKLLRKL